MLDYAFSPHYKGTMEAVKTPKFAWQAQKTCIWCHATFMPYRPNQIYCQEKCRKAGWESRHPRMIIDPKWLAKYGKPER